MTCQWCLSPLVRRATEARVEYLKRRYCSVRCARLAVSEAKRPKSAAELAERFWQHVAKSDGCWLWTKGRNDKGYGQFRVDGKMAYAHRIAYEFAVGPIPVGLHIDHLCRNTSCVRPDHLEPVTGRENFLRGVHPLAVAHRTNTCKRGHRIEGANEYIRPGSGRRMCAECQRMRRRRRVKASA